MSQASVINTIRCTIALIILCWSQGALSQAILLPAAKVSLQRGGACGYVEARWQAGRVTSGGRFVSWTTQRKGLKRKIKIFKRRGLSPKKIQTKLRRLQKKFRRMQRSKCALLSDPLGGEDSTFPASRERQNKLFSTQAMDTAREVILAVAASRASGRVESKSTDTVTGAFQGAATLEADSSDTDSSLPPSQGTIILDEFRNRFGYQPSDGELNFGLEITATSIKGSVSTDTLLIADVALSFTLTYDLSLEDGTWVGTVNGSIQREGEEAEPIDGRYDTPVLVALRAVPLRDGQEVNESLVSEPGAVRLKYWVLSNAPISWINTSWDSPLTNLEGGGSGTHYCYYGECSANQSWQFQEVEKGYWMYFRDYELSSAEPNGLYSWRSSVRNASELTSEEKIATISFTGGRGEIQAPIIHSVAVTTENVGGGRAGSATLHVVGQSADEPTFLTSILDGPLSNVQGGGSGTSFTSCGEIADTYCEALGAGYWYTSLTVNFSRWAPNGTYRWYYVSIETDAHLPSDTWQETLTFEIAGNPVANTPTITDVKLFYYSNGYSAPVYFTNGACLDADDVPDPLVLGIEITANSNAPVSWVNSSFDGPAGNLHGGGSGTNFESLGASMWKGRALHFLPAPRSAPKGEYSWTTSVKNEGERTSSDYASPLTFSLAANCP